MTITRQNNHKTRQDKTRQDQTRQGSAEQGKAGNPKKIPKKIPKTTSKHCLAMSAAFIDENCIEISLLNGRFEQAGNDQRRV
jgi:hypothetical protein